MICNNGIEEIDWDFRARPLLENKQCFGNTPYGACTLEAKWQIGDYLSWTPLCYIHMRAVFLQYKQQRQQENEELKRINLARTPTQKIPLKRITLTKLPNHTSHQDPDS